MMLLCTLRLPGGLGQLASSCPRRARHGAGTLVGAALARRLRQ